MIFSILYFRMNFAFCQMGIVIFWKPKTYWWKSPPKIWHKVWTFTQNINAFHWGFAPKSGKRIWISIGICFYLSTELICWSHPFWPKEFFRLASELLFYPIHPFHGYQQDKNLTLLKARLYSIFTLKYNWILLLKTWLNTVFKYLLNSSFWGYNQKSFLYKNCKCAIQSHSCKHTVYAPSLHNSWW